jgi:hypothetical protein
MDNLKEFFAITGVIFWTLLIIVLAYLAWSIFCDWFVEVRRFRRLHDAISWLWGTPNRAEIDRIKWAIQNHNDSNRYSSVKGVSFNDFIDQLPAVYDEYQKILQHEKEQSASNDDDHRIQVALAAMHSGRPVIGTVDEDGKLTIEELK